MKCAIPVLASLVLLTGCDVRTPSERAAYRLAREELAADVAWNGSSIEPAPIREAGLYIAKNGGCVVLPFRYVGEGGAAVSASYTVWLKRVARRWTVERAHVAPTYPVEATRP